MVYPFGTGDLGDPRLGEVVAGMTERLGESDLDLIIVSARQNAELGDVPSADRRQTGRRFDRGAHARRRSAHPVSSGASLPFVAYGRTNSPTPYGWFDFDNEAGARTPRNV